MVKYTGTKYIYNFAPAGWASQYKAHAIVKLHILYRLYFLEILYRNKPNGDVR